MARITSGASATNSAAYLRVVARLPAPARMSTRTLRPSVQPNFCSSCQERGDASFGLLILTSYAGEYANAPHTLGLLRMRGERQYRRTPQET